MGNTPNLMPDNSGKSLTKGDLYLFKQEINEKLETLPNKDDFHKLLSSVDGLTGQVKTYNDERSAEGARLERIENWIKKAAEAIKIPVEF